MRKAPTATQADAERFNESIQTFIYRMKRIRACYRFYYNECVSVTMDEKFAKEYARSKTLRMLLKGDTSG